MKLQYVVLALVALAQPAVADEYDALGPIRHGRLTFPDGSIYGHGNSYESASVAIRYRFMICDRALHVAVAYERVTLDYSRYFWANGKKYDVAWGFSDFGPELESEILFEAAAPGVRVVAGSAYESTTFECDGRNTVVDPSYVIDVGRDHASDLEEMTLTPVASQPLHNDRLRDEIHRRGIASINSGGSYYGGIVLSDDGDSNSSSSSGSSSSGSYSSSGRSSSGSGSSGSSSSGGTSTGGTSGGAGQAASSIGGLGGVALAGVASGGGSDGSGPEPTLDDLLNPAKQDGPGVAVPATVTLEASAVGIGLYFVFGYAMNKSLEARLVKKGSDPEQHRKLDWSKSALLGPTFAYTFSAGYVREHRSGLIDTETPQRIDATMSGGTLDFTLRFQALRFQAGYHHMRGNLVGERAGYMYQRTQGYDSLTTGAALQLGWHQAFSPYAGVRYRLDVQNGNFADDFNGERDYTVDRIKPYLQGGRTLGMLGLTVNLPPARHRVMFRSFSLNLELYKGLAGTHIDSGVMITAGMGAWVPPSVGAVNGMTGYDNAEGGYGSWLVPNVFRGGVGLEIVSIDHGHHAVTAVEAWIKPLRDELADFGVAAGAYGYRQRLPGARHSVAFKLTPFSLSRWTTDERLGLSEPDPYNNLEQHDRGRLHTYAFGQLRLEYHAVIRSHLAQVGVRMPLFWWTNRATNDLDFDDMRKYEGSMPMQVFAGFGF